MCIRDRSETPKGSTAPFNYARSILRELGASGAAAAGPAIAEIERGILEASLTAAQRASLQQEAFHHWALLDDRPATKSLMERLSERDSMTEPELHGLTAALLEEPGLQLAWELEAWSAKALDSHETPADARALAWLVTASRGADGLALLSGEQERVVPDSRSHGIWLKAVERACLIGGNFDELRATLEGPLGPTRRSDHNFEILASCYASCLQIGGAPAREWLKEKALRARSSADYIALTKLPRASWTDSRAELEAVLMGLADPYDSDVFARIAAQYGLGTLLELEGAKALEPFRGMAGMGEHVEHLTGSVAALRRRELKALAGLPSTGLWRTLRERWNDPAMESLQSIYGTSARRLVGSNTPLERMLEYAGDHSAPFDLRLVITREIYNSSAPWRLEALSSVLPKLLEERDSAVLWQMVAVLAIAGDDPGLDLAHRITAPAATARSQSDCCEPCINMLSDYVSARLK